MDEVIRELKYKEEFDLIWNIEDAINKFKRNAILDIGDFRRELQRQGLMTEELEEFIENYMRFDNVWRY